jgi:anti-sigma-K factor RskA
MHDEQQEQDAAVEPLVLELSEVNKCAVSVEPEGGWPQPTRPISLQG